MTTQATAVAQSSIYSKTYTEGCRVERDAPVGYARSAFGYPQNVLRRFSADTPHRTVRAVFPHTALRVGLVSSVSLPFASRLRFTLIPVDAPPYGRAVFRRAAT